MTIADTATTSQLPATGVWAIDPSHTNVGFKVRHLGLAKVRGRFTRFDGTVTVGDRSEDTTVEVTIDAASVDTHDAGRDEHLRSADFFDVEHNPQWTFRSTGVSGAGSDWTLAGDLTIAGVTKPVHLDVELEGVTQDPWGATRAGFTASTEIDREDFGLTFNATLETGGFVVGKKVTIELDVELVKQ